MIRYLVSYLYVCNGETAYGNVELGRSEPICSMDDVNDVAKDLREHTGLPRLIVMGFSVFAEPGENGGLR